MPKHKHCQRRRYEVRRHQLDILRNCACKFLTVSLWLVLIVFTVGNSLAQVNEQTKVEIEHMNWRPAYSQHLITSRSTITNLPDFAMVTGPEAIRFRGCLETGPA
jgi:hypothetical protein